MSRRRRSSHLASAAARIDAASTWCSATRSVPRTSPSRSWTRASSPCIVGRDSRSRGSGATRGRGCLDVVSLALRGGLALRELGGAGFRGRGDHVVITSADNPDFYWGNFVLLG